MQQALPVAHAQRAANSTWLLQPLKMGPESPAVLPQQSFFRAPTLVPMPLHVLSVCLESRIIIIYSSLSLQSHVPCGDKCASKCRIV